MQWRWYSSFPSTTSKIKTTRKALLFSDQNNFPVFNCCTLMRIVFWTRMCVWMFFFLILAVVFLELLQYSHWKSRLKHPAAKLDALVCGVVFSSFSFSLVCHWCYSSLSLSFHSFAREIIRLFLFFFFFFVGVCVQKLKKLNTSTNNKTFYSMSVFLVNRK